MLEPEGTINQQPPRQRGKETTIEMKAKKLAEKLMENPEYEVEFGLLEPDESSFGAKLRRFAIQIDDVGHSSRIVILGPANELD